MGFTSQRPGVRPATPGTTHTAACPAGEPQRSGRLFCNKTEWSFEEKRANEVDLLSLVSDIAKLLFSFFFSFRIVSQIFIPEGRGGERAPSSQQEDPSLHVSEAGTRGQLQ